MLDRAGDAAGNIEIAGEFLAGHTDIPVQRQIFQCFRHGSRGADSRAGSLCQVFNKLHILLRADTLTGGDHPLGLCNGGVHGDAHGEVVAVLLQGRHQRVDFLGCIAVPEDNLFPHTGDGSGLFGRRTALASAALTQLAHQMGGDDHPLNLIGPLVDGGNLGVAVGALHLHALEETGAAVDLQGIVGDLQRNVRGVHLRHGRLHAVRLMVFLQFGCGINQEPGAAQLGGHIRQLKGNALLGGNGLAELDTFFGIGQRVLKGSLSDPQCLGGNTDTAAVQRGHGDFEALALLAQQVFLGNLYVVEDQLRRGGGADAHFIIVVTELEAFPTLLHNKSRDAPGADVRRGDGEDHIGVRLWRVGDEDLAAVEQPVVALVNGSSFRTAGIGAGVGFRQAKSADLFSPRQGNQIFLLLLLGAEGKDGPRAQRYVGRQDHTRSTVHPGQLFHSNGIAENVQSHAAVFLGIRQAEPTQLPHFPYGLGGKFVLLIQHKSNGLDLLLREFTDLGTQFFVRRGRLK